MKKLLILMPSIMLISGCIAIQPVVPAGIESATVIVSTNLINGINFKVRYQGINSCETYPGKLIGIINSKTIGIDGGNPISAKIPANNIEVISVVGMVPLPEIGIGDILLQAGREKIGREYASSLREKFFAFTPRPGKNYYFEFNFNGKDIKLSGYEKINTTDLKILAPLKLPSNCMNIPIQQM